MIGGLILNNEKVHDVKSILTPEHFYNKDLSRVYSLITTLNTEFDVISLSDRLGYEWIELLGDCVKQAATNGSLLVHAQIVKDNYYSRVIKSKLAEQINSLNDRVKPQTIIDDLNHFLTTLEQPAESAIRNISESFDKFIDEMAVRYENRGQIKGLTTGIADLDQSIQGMQDGNLIIIAGRPAMGKSVLAQNIGQHNALLGKKVVMFSLEMTEFEIQQRMASSVAGIDYGRIQDASCINDDNEFVLLGEGLDRIRKAHFYIDDSSSLSISSLKSKCMAFERKMKGIDLIIIDYLQLLSATGESRFQEVSTISRELKSLAKALKCPVIALSQLSRSLESRADKRPLTSDLRESGQLEQDADKIIFIYRDEVYNKDTQLKGLAELIIGKARNCPRKDVVCYFDGAKQTFRQADHTCYEIVDRGKAKPKNEFSAMYKKR